MFQLIVAVISIALVAALAIASIYYGGSAFNQGTLKANVTTLINAGQQISGAQALYVTTYGDQADSIFKLYDGAAFLSGAPATSAIAKGGWTLIGGKAYVSFADSANLTKVCAAVAEQAGSSPSPQFYCADATGTAAPAASAKGLAYKL